MKRTFKEIDFTLVMFGLLLVAIIFEFCIFQGWIK